MEQEVEKIWKQNEAWLVRFQFEVSSIGSNRPLISQSQGDPHDSESDSIRVQKSPFHFRFFLRLEVIRLSSNSISS